MAWGDREAGGYCGLAARPSIHGIALRGALQAPKQGALGPNRLHTESDFSTSRILVALVLDP